MEERRIFTHPDVVQAGNFAAQYNSKTRNLICHQCREAWYLHSGWACGEDSATIDDLAAPTPASVTHSCARCDMVLHASAVALPDVEVDTMFAKHGEVCERRALRVGDWVRWERLSGVLWAEGELVSLSPDGRECYLNVAKADLIAGTRYDGLTGWECLERFAEAQRSEGPPNLKPAQLAAARELWGLQLKAKVAASDAARKEREVTVVATDDDAWLANCKDAP